VADEALIPKKARKDAQAIAALLRFAPIRIENPQPEFASVAIQRAEKDPIRPHPEVPMANQTNGIDIEISLQFRWADYDVVVAYGMVF
jgi:hypothetical protein